MTDTLSSPSLAPAVLRAPLTVSVNLGILQSNFQHIREFIDPTTKILPIIKADAYGHGAVQVAHSLAPLDIFGFGVASVSEGILLRNNDIESPILIMGPLLGDHLRDVMAYNLTPVISHPNIYDQLLSQLPSSVPSFPIHLKIDTGLHRLGLDVNEARSLLQSLKTAASVRLQGLLTHFADADNPDPNLTNQQIHQFHTFLAEATKQDQDPIPICHMANSAGILFHSTSHLEMVRPGIMLYGYAPGPTNAPPPIELQPVMQATTYIAHLRSLEPGEVVGYNALFRTRRLSRIAVLPVGYTHGFPRHLTGIGHVLIRRVAAPIIGKICMDMMMVDVTDIPHTKIGEEVILLGKQGDSEITAQDYAGWLNTIPYEILCGIGGKANRTYIPPT